MTEAQVSTALWTASVALIHLAFVARAILRPHREPASRVAWVVVIIVLPIGGIIAYVLFGEVRLGRRRVERMRTVLASMPAIEPTSATSPPVPDRYEHLFRAGRSVNGFPPVGGNRAKLLNDSNATIEALVADIDGARQHVHVLFYIWLSDRNGLKVVDALKRAAARGVVCRAMADGMGSRALMASTHWRSMRDAGVQVATALPIGNPLLRPLRGRIDLRNHRKIIVIDNLITYCGSQNCADPEFLVKAKFAPWVDLMLRIEGPIARQNQHLFASDWMAQVDDPIGALVTEPMPPPEPGATAQVIGTGPTIRANAMPEIFETLIFSARHELFITTPYYVPNEAMQSALCAAARRGVETTIVLPARNDSFVVAAASRSYYAELLEAGVRLFEYEAGLLHAKSLTLDGEISLVGSANMDRRSFELNFENNILFHDRDLARAVRQRQLDYLTDSHPVTLDAVRQWAASTRLFNNAIGILGPVL